MPAAIALTEPEESSSSVFHRHLATQPLFVKSARGVYLHLDDGREIIDGCAGAAVASVGHGEQRVIDAVARQLAQVAYTHCGEFGTRVAEDLAHELTSYISPSTSSATRPFSRAVFYSGGSEALESCIKLARQFHIENGQPERTHFVARGMSYHGNTLGALQLGRFMARRTPYEPILNERNFHAVSPCFPYRYKPSDQSTEDYVASLAQELEDKLQELGPNKVAAFFLEPVVGAASGCAADVPGYLQAMREVCDRHGVLLCYDEIMCGMGRTGTLHAWEHAGVPPDLQACGKGLSGGYAPLSCVLLSPKVVRAFASGTGAFVNGFTYQSYAVGAAAAKAVLDIFKHDNVVERCRLAGATLERLLRDQIESLAHVGEVRGRGLFWAIELVSDKRTAATYTHEKKASLKVVDGANDWGVVERDGRVLGPEIICQRIVNHMLTHGGAMVYPCTGTVDGFRGDHLLIAPPLIISDLELVKLVTAARDAIIAVCGN